MQHILFSGSIVTSSVDPEEGSFLTLLPPLVGFRYSSQL